jgi:hypothetical protein
MDLATLDAVLAFAAANGPPAAHSPPPPIPAALAALLPHAHARDAFRRLVRGALELVGSMLALFPLEALALTFNGGKDACVVFYLVRAAVAAAVRRGMSPGVSEAEVEAAVAAALRRVAVLYFAPKHGEFETVSAFMDEVAAGTARVGKGACGGGGEGCGSSSGGGGGRGGGGPGSVFAFEYTVYHVGYQDGMRDMVDARGLKAVFMGVRSGDPYSRTCVCMLVCGGACL